MKFEVVEIPWALLPEEFFPEDIAKVDTTSLEPFASFRFKMHADEWRDRENRVWDAGCLVVREVSDD